MIIADRQGDGWFSA